MTEHEAKQLREAIEFYEELANYYGSRLANFENHPRVFAFQVKAYKYVKDRQKK